jgi:deoxyadenosine/deoxycytidine kinase
MTRKAYLKLVRSSPIFQQMEPKLQAEILRAKGEAMKRYARTFEQAKAALDENDKQFWHDLAAAYKEFEEGLRVRSKKARVTMEAASKLQDEEKSQQLLKQI